MRHRYSALPIGDLYAQEDARSPARPFLKWAGGKWAIAARLEDLLPRDWRRRVYREPFLGGGAMFFRLQPERAVLSDAVGDLIDTYRIVHRQAGALIAQLEGLRANHSTEQFYKVRDDFNARCETSGVQRAAWLIYLNKTCYNGLFRTNRGGLFNVPVGRFTKPAIADPENLHSCAAVLSRAELEHKGFEHLLDEARAGDMIYLDPPYVPISKTSSFSAYADGTFTLEDQARLARVFHELDARGCFLALSNSETKEVRELYAGYDFTSIFAPRAISSKASTRGEVMEVLIRNYVNDRGAAPRLVGRART
jgi:DNA adenine methylase